MARSSARGLARDALRADTKARNGLAAAMSKAYKGHQLPDGSGVSASKASTIDSLTSFAHKIGMGADNILSTAAYTLNPLTRQRLQLEWAYRGSWLAEKVVDCVAEDMTRAGIEFTCELPPDDSDKMEKAATTLNVWGQLEDTIRWGRLYGGCIAVALIDGHNLREPLNIDTIGPGQFKGMLVLDRWMVDPTLEDLVTELGPDLGKPKYYRVQPNAPAMKGQVIHHSRVLLRHEGTKMPFNQRLTENLWGTSVLERVYDRMVGYDLATSGAAQLVTKSYVRTLKIKGLRELAASGGPAMDGLTKYVDLMRRMQGIEGMSMIDGDDEMTIDSTSAYSGLADCMSAFGEQLSGATDIPLIRLFGQSPGGFGDGDTNLRNYYDHTNKRQNSELLVPCTRLYNMLAKSCSVKLPPDFALKFRSLWQLPVDIAVNGAKTLVETVAAAQEAGLISQKTGMRELRQGSRSFNVFSNISEADIDAADDQVQAPPPPGMDDMLGALKSPGTPGGPGGLPAGFGNGKAPPGLPEGFGGKQVGSTQPAARPRVKINVPTPQGLPEGFGPEHAAKFATLPEKFGPDDGLPAGFGPEHAQAFDGTKLPAPFGPHGKAKSVPAQPRQRVAIQLPAAFGS